LEFNSLKNLSSDGRFISGFLIGDFLQQIDHGLYAKKIKKVLKCLKHRKVIENKTIVELVKRTRFKIDIPVINGAKRFFDGIVRIKKIKDIKRIFKDNLNDVKQFLKVVDNLSKTFVKLLKKKSSGYFICRSRSFPLPLGSLFKHSLKKKFDFKKEYLCSLDTSEWIFPISKDPKLISYIKDIWMEQLKKKDI